MGEETSVKGNIEIADRVINIKAKLTFLDVAIARTLSESGFSDEVVVGYQATMTDLENELEEIIDKLSTSQCPKMS